MTILEQILDDEIFNNVIVDGTVLDLFLIPNWSCHVGLGFLNVKIFLMKEIFSVRDL